MTDKPVPGGTPETETVEAVDAIVVGTSPLLLIEALCLEAAGKRVVVLEQSSRAGGAWYSVPLWEFESVEVGCHYIERGRRGYRFLEECLGIQLAPQTVKAVWVNAEQAGNTVADRLTRRLLWKRFLSDDTWGIIKSIDRKDPGKFARAIRRMLASPAYRYPANGIGDLVAILTDRLTESSAELRMGTKLDSIDTRSQPGVAICSVAGQPITARQVVAGQHTLPWLSINGVLPADPDEALLETNVLVRIDGQKTIPFEYFEIHRNEIVNRVADVTPYAHPASSSSDLLVCCNLTSPALATSVVNPEDIFRHLVAIGLFKPGASYVDGHVERYLSPQTAAASPPEPVQVVSTYDLGVSLQRNAGRWHQVFEKSRPGISAPA